MRHHVVDDGAGLDDPRPFRQHGDAESTFVNSSFLPSEGVVAAIRPSEKLGSVVAREHHDRIVFDAKILNCLGDLTDFPVQFHHRIAVKTGTTFVLPLLREVSPNMAAGRAMPEE